MKVENGGKKQVVFIHGASAFSSQDSFLQYLKTVTLGDPFEEFPKRWKNTLREDLGEEYEVYLPAMPNKQNAKYEEWKIWFERHFEFLRDGVILIGHSQGGYFLAKYLSENEMAVQVAALFLVAAPIEPNLSTGRQVNGEEDGGDFNFDISKLSNLAGQIDKIFIFHSKDDPVVPFVHAEKYKAALPDAELVSFDERGHFVGEEFEELINHIKNI